ncbi:hypothetical protein ACJJIK_10145 [Microbulbifer sp. ZKSA006]|uniref:hypothetical protein n=1 Tax=Microbulbifer sp. ZKSA006 TaxID=3243390 RepID=UPI0040391070
MRIPPTIRSDILEHFECNIGAKLFAQPECGRRIFASNKLAGMLEGLQKISRIPSNEGYHALTVISAVNSLRGSAAPLHSFLKNGSATRRCIAGAGFEIEYELHRVYDGRAPQTDVGIVDIRFTQDEADEADRAALWDIEWVSLEGDRGEWKPNDEPSLFLKTGGEVRGDEGSPLKIGINGYSARLEHAASILPSHIARGDQVALKKLKSRGYTLFYVPQGKGAVKAGWRCTKNLGRAATEEDILAARILAGHMKEAHDKGLYVEWISHRGGSKVLTKAMEQLELWHINLQGKQKIFLSDATSSQYLADEIRRRIGMNTSDTKWFNSTPGVAQLIGGSNLGLTDVAISLNVLVNHAEQEGRNDAVVDVVRHAAGVVKKIPSGSSALLTMLFASIPSLTETYNTDNSVPFKQLLKKLPFSR